MHCRKLRRADAVLPRDPDPDFLYSNLVGYMHASSSIRHHALHSHHFTGEDLSVYDRVYRTEEIGDLAADLSEQTGREVTIPRFNRLTAPLRFDDLQPATRDRVMQYLEREYALLKDYYPPA